MSKPGASQDIKWEHDLCYLVGAKMFAATNINPPFQVSLKVDPEAFEDLIERPGIVPAPYLARAKWVKISDVNALSLEEWEQLLEQSYQMIFGKLTKKMQREISGQ